MIENNFDFSYSDLQSASFGSQTYKLVDQQNSDGKSDEMSISLGKFVDLKEGMGLERGILRDSTNNTDNAWGINHRQVPLALQQSRDSYGLVFFTRPQLNLMDVNLRKDRIFSRLLTDNNVSVQRIVRCLLDPRLQYNLQDNSTNTGIAATDSLNFNKQSYIECPLVDMNQAFIPFLSNNIVSLSGFPDTRASTYSSKEGPYKEAYSYIDGPVDDYTEYDITGTFRNIQGDPISSLIYNWVRYSSKVHEGVLNAYSDFIVNREIDYNTRIYRFVLDPTKRFVQRMACTGASYPYALGNGSYYDHDTSKPFNEASNTIQVPFKSMGAIYEDDIIIRSFNDVVSYFNPSMKADDEDFMSEPDASVMTKIPVHLLGIFNHRGYPYINPYTYELSWYVSTEYFQSKIDSYKDFMSTLMRGAGIIL